MTDETPLPDGLEPVLSLAELAAMLGVPVQTLYDLRSRAADRARSASDGT